MEAHQRGTSLSAQLASLGDLERRAHRNRANLYAEVIAQELQEDYFFGEKQVKHSVRMREVIGSEAAGLLLQRLADEEPQELVVESDIEGLVCLFSSFSYSWYMSLSLL